MFGNGRRKTQGQLAKVELGRGVGHLKQAAAHATKGTGAAVGPRVQAARSAIAPTALVVRNRAASGYVSTVAALAPLVVAVRDAQAEAAVRAAAGRRTAAVKQSTVSRKVQATTMRATRRKKKSGRGRMAGLLAVGAVVGLAGAAAMRRRHEQREWVEYDPVPSLEPLRDETGTIEVTTRTPAERAAPAPAPAGNSAKPAGTSGTTAAGTSGTTATGTSGTTATGAGNSATTGTANKSNPGRRSTGTPTDKVPATADGTKGSTARPADDLSKAMKNGRR